MNTLNSDLLPGSINVYLEEIDRRGRHKATLADGTVLAVSSQPFVDAARALIAGGYNPEAVLVGWRKGGPNWVLRSGLGTAAKLTVDGTKTVFAKWKPFSSSAIASSMRFSGTAGTGGEPAEAFSGAATYERDPPDKRRRPRQGQCEAGEERPPPTRVQQEGSRTLKR
jgi:hypothetical protein